MAEKKPEIPRPKEPKERSRPRPNIWMITTFAVMAVFAASLLLAPPATDSSGISGAAISTVSSQQVAEDTIDFINSELLEGQVTAELVNVTEKSGLYLVTFKIGEQMYSTYASKDGKYILPQAINVEAFDADIPASHPVDTTPEIIDNTTSE